MTYEVKQLVREIDEHRKRIAELEAELKLPGKNARAILPLLEDLAEKDIEILDQRQRIAELEHKHRNETNAQTAKERYDKSMDGYVEIDPLERLRFFCSLAMKGRDWFDVEQFFNDVKALIECRQARIDALILEQVHVEMTTK